MSECHYSELALLAAMVLLAVTMGAIALWVRAMDRRDRRKGK